MEKQAQMRIERLLIFSLVLMFFLLGPLQAEENPRAGGPGQQEEELKVLKGDPDGKLRPEDAIKRNELIQILDRSQRDLESETSDLAPKTGLRELLDLLQQAQGETDALEHRVTELESDQDRLEQREEHLPRPSL